MESSTATKKKKRRTRKCLDEIRNRSRRTIRGEGDSGQTSQRGKENSADKGQVTRLITTNRLTLNMFPKAIRSETITRPKLKEKQKSNFNFQNVDNNSLSKPLEVECLELSNSASKNSIPTFDLEESLQEQVKNHIDIQMRNDSPIHEHFAVQAPAAELIANVHSTTSLSSQTSDGDHGQELYEEVMNKISSHLKKVTSAFVEDTLKKTKVNLQKLYIKSWSKQFNNSMVEHEQSSQLTARTFHSQKDSIVQNPLDYIRLSTRHEQQQQQGLRSPCPSQPLSLVPSPAVTTMECTPHGAFYHTPEYNYYPHRLN